MDTLRIASAQDLEPDFRMPEWRSPMIGRGDELLRLRSLLGQDDVWLVTITGPGGVGKSRVAHAAGRSLESAFRNQVGWVSLASATSEDQGIEVIARSLGLTSPGIPASIAIIEALAGRDALLILDNLEQVPDLAAFIARLSIDTPTIKILATSRTPLHLGGEQEFALAPFRLPEPSHAVHTGDLAGIEAIELFTRRAQAADATFVLTDHNAAAVMEICRRLDGLPLAIELAAARVRLLPPDAMVPRLANRLELLTAGPRDAPSRQQTLRNAIQWSYDLLPPGEQQLFRRLSVFPASFSLEAAASVSEANDTLLDSLAALLDHSLCVRLEQSGESRFAFLDTIREFAVEVLSDASEREAARERHARYFAHLIDALYERPSQHREWLDLVDSEIVNIRAALEWFEHRQSAEALMSLCNQMQHWWLTRGTVSEGREWYERALRVEGRIDPAVRISGLMAAAWLTAQAGNLDRADAVLSMIDEDDVRDQDVRIQIKYDMVRGAIAFYKEDLPQAFAHMDHAREFAERAGLDPPNPSIRINLGAIAAAMADWETARLHHEQGLAEVAEPGIRAMHAISLSEIELRTGHIPRALAHILSAWHAASDLGHFVTMISAMASKVDLLVAVGQPVKAAQLLGAADEMRQRVGWAISAQGDAEYNGLIDKCRASLPSDEFERALHEGRVMPQDEIDALMRQVPDLAPATQADSVGVQGVSGRSRLTSREHEVLRELVQGKTNPEIAGDLFISERTVQTHVANILQKLGVPSRTAAATIAVRDGIV